jgi:hypothetical protein
MRSLYLNSETVANQRVEGWYTICVSGGYRGMGRAEKMDCGVKGEFVFLTYRPLVLRFSAMFLPRGPLGLFEGKEMGYAI